ncbi:MAG: M6 family metalloprotease domain-containing protein [Phycisphaerae bacterium]|nr:M6 family metalloprotease domain-containing protein [Phycisphaerae bacterium]
MGEIYNLRQPDGATVTVKIWGDEFYQVVESLDGYTLIRDPNTAVICYARLSTDGAELLSTQVRAGQSRETLDIEPHIRISPQAVRQKVGTARTQLAAKTVPTDETEVLRTYSESSLPETVRGICLIIDFPDEPGTILPAEVNNFCNQIGYTGSGNNGSVRDYFYDVSDGDLLYTNYVPTAYYTAIHEKSYYDNPSESVGPKAIELILEALNYLEDNGFDFSQYNFNGVSCLYAGNCDSGWSKGLWPHQGSISFSADGVSINKYMIASLGSGLKIGVFCHETGHLLCGWPDLYDTDFGSRGVGKFCLMGYGGQGGNPVEPCAYLKYISGWTDTTLLTAPQEGLVVTAGDNSIYKYEHPTLTNEYFLIENRQRTGRDSTLPDSGLAIWHIDTEGWNNNQQMTPSSHYEVTLVQADSLWDLENNVNNGDSNDLWKAPEFTVCGPYISPNMPDTSWWDGTASYFGILDISLPGTVMTFTFGLDPLEITPEEQSYITGPSGGPYIPPTTTYTITNSGDSAIEYLVSKTEPWFDIYGSLAGTLEPNETADILVNLNENTEQLPPGYYTATIRFSNETGGVAQGRSIILEVQNPVVVICETDFNEGLPDNWSITDGYGDGKTWNANNSCGRGSDYWNGPFMIVDNLCDGSVAMDERLITRSFDCSRYNSVTLKFSHFFTTSNAVADVDIWVGKPEWKQWENVARYTAKSFGENQLQLPDAVGQDSVWISWHYVANGDYYWGIDDVQITGSCAVTLAGDLNLDCCVDIEDLVVLTNRWLNTDCDYPNGWCYGTDLNRSGAVNLYDLAEFAEHWYEEAAQP